MTVKLNTLFVLILLIVSPLIYYYIASGIHSQILFYPAVIYSIFILLAIFFSLYLEKRLKTDLTHESKQLLFKITAIGITFYALYLLFVTWYMYVNFYSRAVDLTYFYQTIWQLSEFKLPYIWALNTPLYPVWSQHFSPILAFIAPILWISHDEGILMLVQAIVPISGALPIYLIAKRYLHSRGLGLAIGFAYLAFGGLQFGIEYGFHEILFFPTIFLWAYYFYISKKIKLYFLFLLLALFAKEEVSFIVFSWGLYVLIFRKDKFIGVITAAFGVLWYILCFNIIFPYFNQGKGFGYWGQYATNGSSGFFGIVKATVLNPLSFLQTLFSPSIKIDMMLETFGQFAFLLFLFPPAIIIIFPSLMEKLLSSGIAMGNGAHYSAAIAAVTVVATCEAIPHLYKNKLIKKYIVNKTIFFTILIFYTALFSNVFFGFPDYSLLPNHKLYFLESGLTGENQTLLTQIINAIPSNATVAANSPILAHLNRYYKNMIDWPTTNDSVDFIIIDTQFLPVYGSTGQEYNSDIDKLNNNRNYQLTISNVGILVYRRKSYNLK